MSSRTLSTLALAACLAVTLLLWTPGTGRGQASSVADLTAPVHGSNCNPCHARIAETDVVGLRFSHGNHLLVECVSCHVRAPHEAGATYRPLMDTCFSCHGLKHGAQGILAAGECSDCHTPAHDLRPAIHVKDWAAKPHAVFAKKTGVNRCMMCHESVTDCDVCHRAKKLDLGPMPAIYLRNLPIEAAREPVLIDARAVPTMSQCVFCHPDVDRTANGRLVFAHEPHIKRDYKCNACHDTFPHVPDRTIVPTMSSCYRCHSLNHSDWGEVATQDCFACHPKDFTLIPPNHTQKFITGEHKDLAKADTKLCIMCHKAPFCVPCHNGQAKLANGQQSPVVLPADHREREWQPDHGKLYLAQTGACSVCHTPGSCIRCHFTPMPHPSQWITIHADNGYPQQDCTVCHKNRETCQECHHSNVTSNELVAANCVECHEEMKTEPPTRIKNIPLAEHAVHFKVAESKGAPYLCDQCHIGYAVARVMQPSTQTQAHDLRLCYDCHGNLDIRNQIIAPYPGSELCRRCHEDLNI